MLAGGAAARGFLRHHAHTGKQACKAFEDHGFAGVVGGGHRRKVSLGPRVKRVRAGGEDRGGSHRDDGGELVEQPAVHSV